MPLPDIDTGKRLVITLEPHAGIVLRDASGRDIASIIVNDRYLKRTRLVLQVAEDINVRRESKEGKPCDDTTSPSGPASAI